MLLMSSVKTKAPAAAQPSRTGGSITFSISCKPSDQERIDIRAKALNMDRSAYLIALSRQDLMRGTDSDFVLVTEDRLTAKTEVGKTAEGK